MSHKDVQMLSVALLIQKADDIIFAEIMEIAQNVKVLKIITDNINKFSYAERKLYKNYGIGLQVTSNRKKSLKDVDIVVNLDFNEQKLKECKFNPLATIISVNEKIEPSNIKGNIVDYYQIEYNEDVAKDVIDNLNVDNNVLYESLIYTKGTYSAIKKQLNKDEIRVVELYGNGEKITKKDFGEKS